MQGGSHLIRLRVERRQEYLLDLLLQIHPPILSISLKLLSRHRCKSTQQLSRIEGEDLEVGEVEDSKVDDQFHTD